MIAGIDVGHEGRWLLPIRYCPTLCEESAFLQTTDGFRGQSQQDSTFYIDRSHYCCFV